jgi:hypothetical protein
VLEFELVIRRVVPLGIDRPVVRVVVAEIVQVLELLVHVPPRVLHEVIERTTGFGGGLLAIAAGAAARSATAIDAATGTVAARNHVLLRNIRVPPSH